MGAGGGDAPLSPPCDPPLGKEFSTKIIFDKGRFIFIIQSVKIHRELLDYSGKKFSFKASAREKGEVSGNVVRVNPVSAAASINAFL